jgi:hypothetical protein
MELNFATDDDIITYIEKITNSMQLQQDRTSVSFTENVSDDGIKAILSSKLVNSIQKIFFNFCENINAAKSFSDFSRAVNLQDLTFLYCPVVDNDLLYYISQCASIQSLSIIGCVSLDPWTTKHITSVTNLRKLTLNHNEYITTEEICQLSVLSNLQELDMEDIHLNNESLAAICNGSVAGILKRLNIEENPDVTNIGFHNLTKLSNLEVLRIGVCQATDVGWRSVGKLSTLTALQILGSTNLTNSGFSEFITELTALKEFQICFCDQLTSDLVHNKLKHLTNLTNISIANID